MKILWMSLCAPYDCVAHGGGQNHNYFIKYFKKKLNANITLLTLYEPSEKSKLDCEKYGIETIYREYNKESKRVVIQNLLGKLLVYRHGGLLENKAYHLFLSEIDEYVSKFEKPDVIITQWTETSLLVKKLKKHYPDALYVAIEEDVAFLGYERKYLCRQGLMRGYKKIKYLFLKKREIEALKKYNIVVPLNEKDRLALLNNGIDAEKIVQACSYHGVFSECKYNPNKYDLLFYGAMNRKENYESVIWFIENVFSKLDSKYRLFIVGGNPQDNIKRYSSNRIIVTGFVDDVSQYFERCLCLVAPLVLGAGIKIKVLEALSAGLPVVTNEIGAEGIGLVDNESYVHCSEIEQYIAAITRLNEDSQYRNQLSINGKNHVNMYFSVSRYLDLLMDSIINMLG